MKKQFFLIISFILFLTSAFASFAQENDVEVDYASSYEPVKIVGLKIGAMPIESGKKFSASDDWLKDLTVTVKNNYSKTANYVEIGVIVINPENDNYTKSTTYTELGVIVVIPEKDEEIPPYHYTFWLGNPRRNLEQSVLKLKPKAENQADLSLPSKEYASIRSSLNRIGYPPEIKKIKVQVEQVTYEDGTIWALDNWYRADPNDVNKLIPLGVNPLLKNH